MKTGMLWLIDNPKDGLEAAIRAAAAYYAKKYGCLANMCHVHPTMLQPGAESIGGEIAVRAMRMVLPGHLLIGVEDVE